MTGDKRALMLSAAIILAVSQAGLANAQTAPNGVTTPAPPGASVAVPGSQGGIAPSSEQAGLALPTEAANIFARDRNLSVTQRPHEGYEARGVRLGSFFIYPKLSTTAEYNDNIYARPHNTVSDTIWRVAPEVSITSDWSRNMLQAYARATINRYQSHGTEDTNDYGFGVNGRYDILRFSNLAGSVDYARLTEPRTSPNSPGVAASPVQYDLTSASLSGQHQADRFRFTARYQFQNFDYSSPAKIGGGIVDESYRNRNVDLITGRVDYALSPDTAVFAEIDGNTRNYDHIGADGVRRDSSGVQGLVGVNFQLSALTRGELAVGYISQTFKDARLQSIAGFGARGQVQWFPTQLTSATFTASRTIEDSAVPGTGAYLSSNVGVQVDHELLRNVILTARGGYGVDQYNVIHREDHRTSAGLSGTYLLNRNVGLTLAYSWDQMRTVLGVGNPYVENKIAGTLTTQF